MESNESSKILAFDTLFCTNHIQMLKIILPYTDNQTQKFLAVFIKFLELNYTIEFYRKRPYPLCGCMQKEEKPDLRKLCKELLPYCSGEEKKQLEQLQGALQNMEMYQEMSKTMDFMKDMMPEMTSFMNAASAEDSAAGQAGDSAETGSGFNMADLLMNMLTPEQKEMYELFGGQQNAK